MTKSKIAGAPTSVSAAVMAASWTMIALSAVTLTAAAPATADEVGDFYKGKTIHWRVGSSAGGNYSLYARSLAKALSKHIPGNPNIVAQFNPRGGDDRKRPTCPTRRPATAP